MWDVGGAFVSYVLRVLHSEDLLSEVLEVVEGGLSCDGVNQSEALAVLHVQVSHGGELLLERTSTRLSWKRSVSRHGQTSGGSYCSCCVEDLQHALLSINLHLLQTQTRLFYNFITAEMQPWKINLQPRFMSS